MMNRKRTFIIFVLSVFLAGCTVFAAKASESNLEKAMRWAPVIIQCAATSGDYITNVDYDGDWIGSNNWDNFDKFPKKAYIYYDIRETDTHVFIMYSLFHPRDYERDVMCPGSCHENDMESLQVTIRKTRDGHGKLEFVETIAHGGMFLYAASDVFVNGGLLKKKSGITMTDGRPTVYVEKYGHGIYGNRNDSIEANPTVAKYIKYIPGDEAMEPKSISAQNVYYKLVSVYDTLWNRRDCTGDGKCFDGTFMYKGVRLPDAFDGQDYGIDAANVPWGYNQAIGGDVVAGDWFFDPAKAVLAHVGSQADFSLNYVFNPYLDDLQKMREKE